MAQDLAVQPCTVLLNAIHAKSGGGITYLRNLLPLLAAQPGLHLHIVVQADQPALLGDLLDGFPVHVLPKLSPLRTVLWQEQTTIPRLARQIGADVVFSPANYGPLLGRHNVIMLRNAFQVGRLERRLGKKLYWLAVRLLSEMSYRTCRRAIVVSRHAARQFLDVFGMADDGRMEVIHHGVSALFSPPTDASARVPGRLLAVSDIYIQKNLETLVAAMAILAPTRPDLHLRIAGKALDQGYFQLLKTMIEQNGLTGRIEFLGGLPPSQVAQEYQQAQAFVFPSLVETFGNPLLEAMASALPIICARAAALPEVATDCALYAEPDDAVDLARCIGLVLDDPALAAELTGKGLERVREFTWQRTAQATAEILRLAAR